MERIAIFFNRFGPYHITRLNAAAIKLDVLGVESVAQDDIYLWDRIEETHDFSRECLFTTGAISDYSDKELYSRISSVLNNYNPTCVALPGWNSIVNIFVAEWCLLNNVKLIILSESNIFDKLRNHLSEYLKGKYLSFFSSALVGGRSSFEYLSGLGMSPSSIFVGYDVVDNDYFFSQRDLILLNKDKFLKKTSLPPKYFLTSNRFIERKNLLRLLDAYSSYCLESKGNCWKLILLGDGDQKEELVEHIKHLGIEDNVIIPGFIQYDELPVYYSFAGAFIHASTSEQWGLVVNEAMASSLPVLVSSKVGCCRDLVEHGVNGFVFDPYDVDEMTSFMLKTSESLTSEELIQMGRVSQKMIANYSPDTFSQGMYQAVQAALIKPPIKFTFINKLIASIFKWRLKNYDNKAQ